MEPVIPVILGARRAETGWSPAGVWLESCGDSNYLTGTCLESPKISVHICRTATVLRYEVGIQFLGVHPATVIFHLSRTVGCFQNKEIFT